MIVDTDLIGIISASCIMFVLISAITLLLAWKCYQRLERLRVQDVEYGEQQLEPIEAVYDIYNRPGISRDPINIMSGYRPRIYGQEEEISFDEQLSRDFAEERRLGKQRRNRSETSRKQNDDSEVSRDESIIHIFGENLPDADDGRFVNTNSDHRNFIDQTKEHYGYGLDVYSLRNPGGVEIIRGHVITQNPLVDAGSKRNKEFSEWPIENSLKRHHGTFYAKSYRVSGSLNKWVSNDDQNYDNSWNSSDRKFVHEREHKIHDEEGPFNGWDTKRSHKGDRIPDIIVSSSSTKLETNYNKDDINVSDCKNGEARPVNELTSEVEDAVARRNEDSKSLFHSISRNYKVIKKHSAHKPPDWLVQTYAESAASVDVSQSQVESSTQAVQTVETAIGKMISANDYHEEQKFSLDEARTSDLDHVWTREGDSGFNPEHNYQKETKTITVTSTVEHQVMTVD